MRRHTCFTTCLGCEKGCLQDRPSEFAKLIADTTILRTDMNPPQFERYGELSPIPNPPTHVHEWKAPTHNLSTYEHRVFTLCGQMCDCGMMRIYRGPMYGWEEIGYTQGKPE